MLKNHPGLKLPPLTDEPSEKRTISPDEPFVQILDPATGTATFLVEVIEVIHQTLLANWKKQRLTETQQLAAWNEYVPKHLLPRLHGYELMMAPYAIAHMKVGLKLAETGYRFGTDERARIYLTNALEPWTKEFPLIGLDALAHEAISVNLIKKCKRFTVIIGNPPYSKMSGNLSPSAASLINPFRSVNGVKIIMKAALAHELNLQDDYVKFYGLMFSLIQVSKFGIGSYISNFGYLDSPSLQGLRWHYLDNFNKLMFFNLGGRIADRGKYSEIDENVFDIEQGVAISCMIKSFGKHLTNKHVKYGNIIGSRLLKYKKLNESTISTTTHDIEDPIPPFYRFVSSNQKIEAEFNKWPSLDEIFSRNSGGIITSRDNLCINFDIDVLMDYVYRFAHSQRGDISIQREIGFSVKDKWDVERCKSGLRSTKISKEFLKQIYYRPFDVRHIYYFQQLIDTPSRPISEMLYSGENIILLSPRVKTTDDFCHALVAEFPAETKSCTHDRATQMFPIFTRDQIFGNEPCININEIYLNKFEFLLDKNKYDIFEFGKICAGYIYAVLYSPSYRIQYGSALRNSYPRVPITNNPIFAKKIAAIGKRLVEIHLLKSISNQNELVKIIGCKNPEINKISWSNNTVWVDKAKINGLYGVREDVWNFSVGGYQVCEKWLKDRKGRVLSDDDIAHYQKIVVALSETIRLMAEIDEVIEAHGGWPGAFVSGE